MLKTIYISVNENLKLNWQKWGIPITALHGVFQEAMNDVFVSWELN